MACYIDPDRRCHRCPEGRPIYDEESGLCALCWNLLRGFGRTPPKPIPAQHLTKFDMLVLGGFAFPSTDPRFERELRDFMAFGPDHMSPWT